MWYMKIVFAKIYFIFADNERFDPNLCLNLVPINNMMNNIHGQTNRTK